MKTKKIAAPLLCVSLCAMFLAGCGNMSLGPGNYSFTHVHFSDHMSSYCATVEKWYDNSAGIEAKTTEYGAVFLSEGTYTLFESSSSCPYCD